MKTIQNMVRLFERKKKEEKKEWAWLGEGGLGAGMRVLGGHSPGVMWLFPGSGAVFPGSGAVFPGSPGPTPGDTHHGQPSIPPAASHHGPATQTPTHLAAHTCFMEPIRSRIYLAGPNLPDTLCSICTARPGGRLRH